jgi:tetratricopeptide (TPR) repeat protein
MGTAGYMSPEQVRGEKLDTRTDLFSFGLILYEMATGSRPFQGRTAMELGAAILRDAPTPLPATVPSSLRAVILRCLEKSPDARYQSAGEVSSALESVGGSQHVLPSSPSLVKSGAVRWLFLAIPLLLILTLLAFNWRGLRERFFHSRSAVVTPASAPAVKLRKSLAVLGFQNASKRTETAWLSTALTEMLATELSAGDKLRIIPAENVARMERDLSLPETNALASDTLKRVHNYLGNDLILNGGYTTLGHAAGGALRLDVQLQDATTGETVASFAEAGSEVNLFDLVSRVGADLRHRLGIGEVAAVDAAEVQASYPEASDVVRLYAEGIARLRDLNARQALDPLQKAIAADPKFPMAHYALASAWSQLGFDDKAKDEAKLAFELSGSLSRQDRMLVEARYREMTQDWPVAIDVYRNLAGFFPDNPEYSLRLASAQIRGGKAKDALKTIAALKQLPPPENEDPRISLQEAGALRWLGDPKGMLAASLTAANQAETRGAKFVEASARLSEGSAYFNLGEKDKALAAWEESRGIWASADYSGEVAKTTLNTGIVFHDMGNVPEARKRYEEALSIWRTSGNKAGQLNALANLANLLVEQGDLAGAKKMQLEVLAIAHELGGTDALTLLDLSDVQIALGDVAGAFANSSEAEKMARENGNRLTLPVALAHIAEIQLLRGELKEATKSAQQALDITRQTGDKPHASLALTTLGEIQLDEGNLGEARKNLQEAAQVRNEIGETSNAASTNLLLCTVSIEEGHPADAERIARQVLEEFRKEGHPDDEISAETSLLQALLAQNKLADAESELEKARALSSKSQNVLLRLELKIVDAQIQAASGKPEAALQNLSTAASDTAKYGFQPDKFKALLAHGEIALHSGNVAPGRSELTAVRADAATEGFNLIAQQATAALNKKP